MPIQRYKKKFRISRQGTFGSNQKTFEYRMKRIYANIQKSPYFTARTFALKAYYIMVTSCAAQDSQIFSPL